jgi:hypothetical protein
MFLRKKQERSEMFKIQTLSLLGIAFVVLKLCEIIDWSWWLVLLPFEINLVVFILAGIIEHFEKQNKLNL